MCILGIRFQTLPGCPLALLANREESYARPAAGPRVEAATRDPVPWLGGIDLVAGGTWLGINAAGLVVAVTNRPKGLVPAEPRSRGLLCRSLLAFRSAQEATDAGLRQLNSFPFAGCNLLIADAVAAVVIEAGDELLVQRLVPGLHILTNGRLNDPDDRRIARVRAELSRREIRSAAEWIDASKQICRLQAGDGQPAVCLAGSDRGTVSSTVATLSEPTGDAQYWFAGGPPSTTEYVDLSESLRALLAGRSGAVRHSIQLRGPWKYAAATDGIAEGSAAGCPTGIGSAWPVAGTAQMPTAWSRLLGDFAGRVLFTRRFHGPTNLDPGEAVRIRLISAGHSGSISLNGHALGQFETRFDWRSGDVTGLLQGSDELRIELDPHTNLAAGSAGESPLWESVALEIVDQA